MEAENKQDENQFGRKIHAKERLKLRALSKNQRSVWMGLGMVGWSVVVPALLGTALGIWLDRNYPESFSWTLTLLVTGLFLGCIIAWNWIDKEHKGITQDNNENDE